MISENIKEKSKITFFYAKTYKSVVKYQVYQEFNNSEAAIFQEPLHLYQWI